MGLQLLFYVGTILRSGLSMLKSLHVHHLLRSVFLRSVFLLSVFYIQVFLFLVFYIQSFYLWSLYLQSHHQEKSVSVIRVNDTNKKVDESILNDRGHIGRKYYSPKMAFYECVPVATHWPKHIHRK